MLTVKREGWWSDGPDDIKKLTVKREACMAVRWVGLKSDLQTTNKHTV